MTFPVDETMAIGSISFGAHEVRRQREMMRIYFIYSILRVLIYFSSILGIYGYI